MRQLTAEETKGIKALTEYSVELTLIEPTKNGLEKSIMDATGPVRTYLRDQNVHHFDHQKQGPENKVQIPAYLITSNKAISSMASLYRPLTKTGDPRIWFKNLNSYASPNNVLGIIAFDSALYVINLTRDDIELSLSQENTNPLKELARDIRDRENRVATKLLTILKGLAKRGPIQALLNADTAVGRTLEQILGIPINSAKTPDYQGIELKSFRAERTNRKTLFAQVPSWKLSKFKSSAEILDNFGYQREKEYKLYCTVSTLRNNSQGLRLRLERNGFLVEQSDKPMIRDFVIWELKKLHDRLLEKHNETFWISADSIWSDGVEYFTYKKVEHTRKPITSQFDVLLERGIITLDHLIKRATTGKVVEKGPLFKIRPNSIGLLFPPTKIYDLL